MSMKSQIFGTVISFALTDSRVFNDRIFLSIKIHIVFVLLTAVQVYAVFIIVNKPKY
jgi:hypothetical protein